MAIEGHPMRVYMYICMHARMYACFLPNMYVCMYQTSTTCMHACMYVCMYQTSQARWLPPSPSMYVCMYVCMYASNLPNMHACIKPPQHGGCPFPQRPPCGGKTTPFVYEHTPPPLCARAKQKYSLVPRYLSRCGCHDGQGFTAARAGWLHTCIQMHTDAHVHTYTRIHAHTYTRTHAHV